MISSDKMEQNVFCKIMEATIVWHLYNHGVVSDKSEDSWSGNFLK